MNTRGCVVSFVIAGLLVASVSTAPVSFHVSNVFGDHMVLQRDSANTIVWGFAQPGVAVNVTISPGGRSVSAKTGSDTVWRLALPSLPAGGPYNLVFASSDGGSATLSDVLFGDVYLCGGQSNMQVTVAFAFNATAEIQAANNYPLIRLMTVGQGTWWGVEQPLQELATIEQPWSVASNKTIADSSDGLGSYFSAVCWFFGRDLFDGLGRSVPIGLVSDNFGGTPVQYWSSWDAQAKCPLAPWPPYSPWPPASPSPPPSPPGPPGAQYNGTLWNSQIYPFVIGPMQLTGILWFQGEANADANQTLGYYDCALPAMVDDWTSKFGRPGMFFAGVQLAPYIRDATFPWQPIPYLRQAQMSVFNLKNGALVTASDLGDPGSSIGTVHSRNKQPIGARLAAAALAIVYGYNVHYVSPRYSSAIAGVPTVGRLSAVVQFDPSTVGSGLKIVDGASCPTAEGIPFEECAWFGILASDGNWYNATSVSVQPDGTSIELVAEVSAANSTAPLKTLGTQFGFAPWPVHTLYSSDDWPAFPWNELIYP